MYQRIRYIVLPLAVLLMLPLAQPTQARFQPSQGIEFSTVAKEPPFYRADADHWADSLMKTMTPLQRIGQLFMVAAYSNKDAKHVKEISTLITQYKIGGLIFMQGGPVRQANLTNKYQKLSKTPLLIAMDAEWGLSMRLDSTPVFPRQMTLGAIRNDSLIYTMGREIARECKRIGVHVSFSPVADVNNNAANPVIGMRSFGENKYSVADKGIAYMQGLQDGGVLACGKHFPGHGDTDSDSHKTLPIIKHDTLRLDSLELYPFKRMIHEGLGSMMVAHLYVPAYDTTTNTATTLSAKVVNGLLKTKLGFKGLVFTDALNMKGVSGFFKPGEVSVKALLAGNDMLLFSEDVPTAVKLIQEAITKGEITQAEIDARCKKILMTKFWCGLKSFKPIKTKNLINDLNTTQSEWICRQLAEHAVTLVKNDNNFLPLTHLDTCSIASVAYGSGKKHEVQQRLALYAPMKQYNISWESKKEQRDSLLAQLSKHDVILLSLCNTSYRPKNNYGIDSTLDVLLDTLLKSGKRVVLNVFASAYALNGIAQAKNCDAVLVSYEDRPYLADLSAQAIFGGIGVKGSLPVSAGIWKSGTGIYTTASRLKYTMPEDVSISRKTLAAIDSIVAHGISEKAFPGCQVFAAKDGKVFLNKSYGHFTYDKKHEVLNSDLYDVASVTKIMASTPAVMRMTERKEINLDERLVTYLPYLQGSNKQDIAIREMMAHQAGLKDWIPFWMRTVDKDGNWKKDVYGKVFSDSFPVRVAPGLFISKTYVDTIYKQIMESSLGEKKFKYSDLGYYFLKQIIEQKSRMLLNQYVAKNFYAPLGLTTMGFQPRTRFSSSQCAPTEYDEKFRKQQIVADVHDQGAAMLGGIAGHAGIFSNANDVGVMMQVFLNGGSYGGQTYFDTATVNEFTRCQFPQNENRRALGFDKPEFDAKKNSPVCDGISLKSFGHQGFTGTVTWADPETGIVFVFLSNRVYPSAEENKLNKLGTRNAILKLLIDDAKQ
jgi:beta-N-acetylhexosaminidase